MIDWVLICEVFWVFIFGFMIGCIIGRLVKEEVEKEYLEIDKQEIAKLKEQKIKGDDD